MRLLLGTTLVLTALVVGACSSDPEAVEETPDISAIGTAPLVTYELGAELLITLNEAWAPTAIFEVEVAAGSGSCSSKRVAISGRPNVTLFLVGASCSSEAIGRGNGEEPLFASAGQLSRGGNITTEELSLGTLTLADVEYFECTNECDFYRPTVGVLELNAPADPAFPTLVIADDYEGATREDIRQFARALSAAS